METIKSEIRALIEQHGHAAVWETFLVMLKGAFPDTWEIAQRRMELHLAAKKLNLIPHTVGQDEIKRRTN